MLKKAHPTDAWVYGSNVIGLALMYFTMFVPIIGWVWIACLTIIALFTSIKEKQLQYVRVGLIGSLLLWIGIYTILTYPDFIENDAMYFSVSGLIISGFFLIFVWIFRRFQRRRKAAGL